MFTAKRWLFLYVLVFLGYNSIYNNNAGALTLDYSKDRFGVMEGVQTDTIFAVSDTTGGDTASQIRYNAGEDKWQYTNDGGTNYYDLHTHSNKATLDLISEALTTTLKTLYDATAADSHIQNTDQYLDQGGANEVAVADAKDAVDKKHSQNTDTGTSGNFAIIGDLTVDTPTLFTTGNKVSIGTENAPVATLMIGGSAPARDLWNAAIEIQPAVGSGEDPSLFFGGQTANEYSSITWTTSTSGSNSGVRAAMIYAQPTSSTNCDLHFRTNNDIRSDGPGPTDRMIIQGDGNVSIYKDWASASGSLKLIDTVGTYGTAVTFYNSGTRMGLVGYNDAAGADYFTLMSSQTNPVVLGTNGTERIRITSDGNVGIGRTPTTYALEVQGDAGKTGTNPEAGHWVALSDERIKSDISSISNAIETIKKLNPVKFKYTKDWMKKYSSIRDGFHYGFIGQEFQKVFPDYTKVVDDSINTKDKRDKDLVSINTAVVEGFLVKAIQEQQSYIEELQKKNAELEKRLLLLENKLK